MSTPVGTSSIHRSLFSKGGSENDGGFGLLFWFLEVVLAHLTALSLESRASSFLLVLESRYFWASLLVKRCCKERLLCLLVAQQNHAVLLNHFLPLTKPSLNLPDSGPGNPELWDSRVSSFLSEQEEAYFPLCSHILVNPVTPRFSPVSCTRCQKEVVIICGINELSILIYWPQAISSCLISRLYQCLSRGHPS